MSGKLIAEGALVPELKLLSDALNPPMSIAQLMPSLLDVTLLSMMVAPVMVLKYPQMSLASTNDLMNTSIRMDYVPLRMPKSK